MTTVRRLRCEDLFRFNQVNLDPLTETYNNGFYLKYLTTWPEICWMAESPSGKPMGYVIGKVEGDGELWHGHVSAVTVSPDYRRMGLARSLMDLLEQVSDEIHRAYFVDLFVRASNAVAIDMYKKLGYSIFREVNDYYSAGPKESAFDMRKPMKRDVDRKSVHPPGTAYHKIEPEDLEWR